MLDFSNVNFEFLTESYNSNKIVMLIVGGLLVVAALVILVLVAKSVLDSYVWCIIGPVCIALGMALIMMVSFPYCKVTVKVEQSEEVTAEYMQNNSNFIEKDGEMYFVTTFNDSAIKGYTSFEDKDWVEKAVQEEFSKIIGKRWLEKNTVK